MPLLVMIVYIYIYIYLCTSHIRASELLRHTRFVNEEEEEEEEDSRFLRNSGNLTLNRGFYTPQYRCVI